MFKSLQLHYWKCFFLRQKTKTQHIFNRVIRNSWTLKLFIFGLFHSHFQSFTMESIYISLQDTACWLKFMAFLRWSKWHDKRKKEKLSANWTGEALKAFFLHKSVCFERISLCFVLSSYLSFVVMILAFQNLWCNYTSSLNSAFTTLCTLHLL